MRSIVLCGGIGRRMWPLSVEKPLLRFGKKSLIERLVDELRKVSDEVVAITNPANNSQISRIVDRTFVQKQADGMGSALVDSGFLEGDVIIASPNDIYDLGLIKEIARYDMAVPGYVVDEYFPGGYISGTQKLESVVEKPGPGNEPSNMIKFVLDKLDGDIFRKYMKGRKGDGEYEKALSEMAKQHHISIVRYEDHWVAIKRPWHILDAMKIIVKGVEIEDDATIAETAIIKGNSYIGKGAYVGDFAIVRDSVVLDGAVIGAHSEIARSYIMENASMHRNYVGDSVIGRNVLMGAGAITANMRFDKKPINNREKLGAIIGDNSKIGVNASIMPGAEIASSIVWPGAVEKGGG